MDQLGTFMLVMLWLSTIICLILAYLQYSSTQALWIHLSTLQYIAHFPLIAANFPLNITYLMSKIVNFLNFKFWELDNGVFGIKRESSNDLGYTENFLASLDSSIVFLIYLTLVLVVLYGLHYVFLKNIRECRKHSLNVQKVFYVNFPVRFLMQTFLCFTLAAFINSANPSFANIGDIVASLLSMVVILVYCSLLFIVIWFLLHNRKKLARP